MPIRVFKFCFSPPARLVHLTAEIVGVPDCTYEEVDLSRGEQLTEEFLEINPKHQVPAIDEDGKYMAESRDICRYLFDKYNKDPSKEHWYPKDPVKRKAVDEWMDWGKQLHLEIESKVVIGQVACQEGMNWRPSYGLILAAGGCAQRCKGTDRLEECINEAEELVRKQGKRAVRDLDLGDIATFQEVSMAMECHPDFEWDDYPNLNNLYSLLKQVPEFNGVHQPFLDFIVPFKEAVASERGTTFMEAVPEFFTSFRTIGRLVSADVSKAICTRRSKNDDESD